MRIGLVGYYGLGNFGDELFLSLYRQQLPNDELVVLTDLCQSRETRDEALPAVIETLDAIIVGGGDLVIPAWFSTEYWNKAYLKKPVIIFGVGVPRWTGSSEETAKLMRDFFQHPNVKWVSARDKEGRAWIEKHLAPKCEVSNYPDPVFAVSLFKDIGADKRDCYSGRFALITRATGNKNQRAQENLEVIYEQVSDAGFEMINVVLATGQTAKDDLGEVAGHPISNRNIVVRDNEAALIEALASCDASASMKFHGCIAGLSLSIPCFALSGTNKFINLYEHLNIRPYMAGLTDVEFPRKFREFLEKRPGFDGVRELEEETQRGVAELEERLQAL